jgi:hypothetical protein
MGRMKDILCREWGDTDGSRSDVIRATLAIVSGLVVGTVVWIVAQLLIHGTCGSILHDLLCSAQPAIGPEITSEWTGADILGLPVAWGLAIFAMWELIVRRKKFGDLFDS